MHYLKLLINQGYRKETTTQHIRAHIHKTIFEILTASKTLTTLTGFQNERVSQIYTRKLATHTKHRPDTKTGGVARHTTKNHSIKNNTPSNNTIYQKMLSSTKIINSRYSEWDRRDTKSLYNTINRYLKTHFYKIYVVITPSTNLYRRANVHNKRMSFSFRNQNDSHIKELYRTRRINQPTNTSSYTKTIALNPSSYKTKHSKIIIEISQCGTPGVSEPSETRAEVGG